MNNLIQADIFFFVTTIAVVALTIALLVALIYTIRLIRELKESARLIREEISDLRERLKDSRQTSSASAMGVGLLAEGLITLFTSLKKDRKTKTKRHTK